MKRNLVLLVLGLSSVASAQPAPRRVAVTLSPIHLMLPMAEVMVEARPAANLGVALIGGLGRVTSENAMLTATAREIGGQVAYYLLRDFSGLHLGAEAIYLSLGDIDIDVSASGVGLALGPFAGWKYTHAIGFTFVAQLGVEYLALSAKSSSSTAEAKKVIPLLNLNAGWSF